MAGVSLSLGWSQKMRKIREFSLTGTFVSDAKYNARHKFENIIEDQLREAGSVPVMDRNTLWTIHWNEDKDIYDFELTMYGVYVGKRKAREEICGWSEEEGQLVYF